MSLFDLAKPKTGITTTGKGLAALAVKKTSTTTADLGTIEGLQTTAEQAGLGTQAAAITDTTPKLSFLQRLGKGLGAFNPAEAILTGQEKGVGEGLKKYATGIIKGLGSTITGKDIEGERRYFSDVAEKAGIKNGIAKFGIGFVGDVLLDPTTYFGGAIARGIGVTAKGATGVALRGVGKVAPDVKTGLELVGTGLQDALGRAFQYGFKASKGAKEDVLTFLSKEQKAKLGLAASNLDRLGTGVLTQPQREELALKMIAGKRAEFTAREAGEVVAPQVDNTVQPLAQEARKCKSAEEFVKAQFDKKPEYGMSHRPSWEGMPPAHNLLEGDAIPRDVYEHPEWSIASGRNVKTDVSARESWTALQKIRDNPDADITIYRAGRENKLNTGDWVTFSKEYAKQSLEGDVEKVYSFKVKAKDVIFAGDDINEFGYYPKSQLTDIWNQANKIITKTPADIARETALKGTSPKVASVIEQQIARLKKIGEQIGLENPYEVYFPFIKNDKVKKFLNESKGIKVGSEGYRKQFKNLLTNDNLELDPAKAFFTRESQIVSDNMTRDFLSGFVKKYGKGLEDFKNSDEALKEGYALIKEKGIFGKDLGYVSKYDASLIRDSISPEFQSINMLAKATGFDALTSLFKRSVTGLFAPFHIRNYVSGHIQNFEALGKDVFNPKNIAIGQKIAYLMGKGKKIPSGTLEIAGKTTKFSDVMKPFVDRFSGDTFYNADFDTALKSGSELTQLKGAFAPSTLKKTLGFQKGNIVPLVGQEATPMRIGRAVGQFIEHQQKATAYITALQQGKSIDESLKLAEAAGFDYRALTRFESQIMRRIIPFYSFTRKNIELQLKTLGENPQRINQVLRFFGNIGEQIPEEEKKNLPDYLKESIGIKLSDTPEGLKQYISSFGTPIEAFSQLFGSNPILRALSMTNPIIKAPVEIGIGKDSFRQRDLKDVYTANEYKNAPQVLKDLLEIKEVKKPVYQNNKKVGEKMAYIADPVKLLIARSLFTSRGVSYLDQLFGNDLKGFVKVLKTTTGLKPQQVDIEFQKYFTDLDKQRALEDLLNRYGVVKKFSKTYIPK